AARRGAAPCAAGGDGGEGGGRPPSRSPVPRSGARRNLAEETRMAGKVAINGLGRIGRAAPKLARLQPGLGLGVDGDKLVVDGRSLAYLSERDPERLPWRDLGVDLVFECTGRFTAREDAERHLRAGARRVVLSGPTRSEDVPTIVHGVNRPGPDDAIFSCASCTTNSVTPLVEILDRYFGVERAMLTSVHAYTATQALVDGPTGAKDPRRGRAAGQSFVPSSTGAARATTR